MSSDNSRLYVSAREIVQAIPFSSGTFDKWVKTGAFPQPLPLPSSRRRIWFRSEVEAWLKNHSLAPLPSIEPSSASSATK